MASKKELNRALEALVETEFPFLEGVSLAEFFAQFAPDGEWSACEAAESSNEGWTEVNEGDFLIEFNAEDEGGATICLQYVLDAEGNYGLVYADVNGEVPEDPEVFMQALAEEYEA